jgi:uncharacterized protein (DUF2336 family)
MYQFILNLWIMGKVTETQINALVTKGKITADEAAMILATPQV